MQEPPEPAVRAHFLALALAALRDAHPDGWERGRVELAETIIEVEGARRLQWLPIERLLELDRAGVTLVGEAGLRRLVLDTMARALRSPVWNDLLAQLIRWLGLGPVQVARWAPRVHALAFRGVGRMRVPEVDAQRALVDFEEVPEVCLAEPIYVASLGYALEFFFELTDTAGEVRTLEVDRDARRVRFEMRVAAAG